MNRRSLPLVERRENRRAALAAAAATAAPRDTPADITTRAEVFERWLNGERST